MSAVTITKEEFDAFIEEISVQTGVQGECITKDGVGMYIYQFQTPDMPEDVVLRVFSTVNTYTNESRDTGESSIKVVLVHTGKNRLVTGRTFTQRIDTWRKNLRPKIIGLLTNWKDRATFCPECGSIMVIQTSGFGKFLGCSQYPKCEEKQNLN